MFLCVCVFCVFSESSVSPDHAERAAGGKSTASDWMYCDGLTTSGNDYVVDGQQAAHRREHFGNVFLFLSTHLI